MPPIKRGCQSCKLFPRLTEHTNTSCLTGKKSGYAVNLSVFPITALSLGDPSQPETRLEFGRSGFWDKQKLPGQKKKNLEALDSCLLHRDVKTLLWSNSDPSGSNNLGRIIYDSVQEQITPKNVWDFPTWGPTREITDMPLSWLKTVPCNQLEIPPLLRIYSSYLLCPQLPVTC